MKTMNAVKLLASILLTASILLLIPGAASALSVVGSEHDLSGTNAADDGRVCAYCHTPHNASSSVVPLWNRDLIDTGFTMYASPTIDMTIATKPQGVSLACLSCHDGTIAVDQLFGDPWNADGSNVIDPTEGAYLGKDLGNDHPISITYNAALDLKFVSAGSGKVGALPLFGTSALPGTGDQVECASCHSVHDDQNMPFLRIKNTNSALCTTCHTI